MKLTILLETPPKQVHPALKTPSLRDKIECCVEEIESGKVAKKEWEFLRKIFNKLATAKKLSPAKKQLLAHLEPIMEKYGQLDPDGVELAATYPSERKD